MTQLEEYFSSYNQYHLTKGNKITHYVGIPLIVFSILGLLSKITLLESVDLGLLFWLGSSIFYCRLSLKKGLPFSILLFALYWFSRDIGAVAHVVMFVVGWILQGIGHYKYEKKSPAFLTNVSHLFIGPFWIFCRLWS